MDVRNAVLFVDYENARKAACEVFFGDDEAKGGDFNPWELGKVICHKWNAATDSEEEGRLKLIGVRVYRGSPDSRLEHVRHASHVARKAAWHALRTDLSADLDGATIDVVDPPIQYPSEHYPSPQERNKPVEKGVDTSIAVDVISWMQDRKCDVVIVFSEDRDHRPAALDVLSRFVSAEMSHLPLIRAGWRRRILSIPSGRLPSQVDSELLDRYVCSLEHNDYEKVADRKPRGWDEIERRWRKQETFEAPVVNSDKNGLVVHVEGVEGFVPSSHIGGLSSAHDQGVAQLATYVGRILPLQVHEASRRGGGKLTLTPSDGREGRTHPMRSVNVGDRVEGRVGFIRGFGVFVDLGGAVGLIPRKELSWQGSPEPTTMFVSGQDVNVYVKSQLRDSRSGTTDIVLSLWRASEQWDEFVLRHVDGPVVPARVVGVSHFNAEVEIWRTNVRAFVNRTDLAPNVKDPRDLVAEQCIIPVKVRPVEGDQRRHLIYASVTEARADAERDGWVFDGGGRVTRLPDDLAAELGIEQDD